MEELLVSSLRVRGALVTASLADHPRGAAVVATLRDHDVPTQEVSEVDFASAADTETPQGILAVAEIPTRTFATLTTPPTHRLLVLDAIQDPGNVGTMLRTAAALGAAATIALPGTVDLWNAKVVRSAMGAHFHHPALSSTWPELDAFLHEREITLWGADSAGDPLEARLGDENAPVPQRLALAFGNEGSGLSPAVRERAARLVALPITTEVESLNVAVAAGIILYELRR